MPDDECALLALRLLIEGIVFLNVVELVQQILIAAARKTTKRKCVISVNQAERTAKTSLSYSLA